MSWILLSVCSAFVLGIYDLLKKTAVRNNAVPPVLFFGVLTGCGCWLLLRCITGLLPDSWQSAVHVDPMSLREHLLVFAKSILVSGSWVFGYFALKHLPITLAGPIRATAPLWTILFAVFFMGEKPNTWQWIGVTIILATFYFFSLLGKAEGFDFRRNKWVACLLAATLIGATCAVFDKYLLQSLGMRVATMQFWFSVYLVVVLLPFVLIWRYALRDRGVFEWRWMIPAVGIGLIIADAIYFAAIAQEGALISVISPVRRTSVIVGFLGGILLLGERRNTKWKLISLVLMLIGVLFLNWKGR